MRIIKQIWAQPVELPDYKGITGWNIGGLDGRMTFGEIMTKLLPYIFVAAGLSMFVMLIVGGFELMVSGGEPGKIKVAQGKLTGGVVGFLIVVFAYFIAQVVEKVFGVNILG